MCQMMAGRNRTRMQPLVARLRAARRTQPLPSLTKEEQALIHDITRQTAICNRNNITRTEAYLKYYTNHPEIHWALLAHMVSRNGGWSMTDIKGEWFTRIAETMGGERLFAFLERINWLIFHDAYPQLLLYEKGKERKQNLSRLLSHLGVSRFMQPIWALFWQSGDSSLLTRALIINEQNFVEQRVIKNPKYNRHVLHSIEFQAQSLFGFNEVIFPYRQTGRVLLAGAKAKQFGSLRARIKTGKCLYRILFHNARLHDAIYRWASEVRPTGSREDYWPDRFSHHTKGDMTAGYKPCFLNQASPDSRVYSPQLTAAWSDVQHPSAEPGDWFHDVSTVVDLFDHATAPSSDFTTAYLDSLRAIERIILAKEKVRSVLE